MQRDELAEARSRKAHDDEWFARQCELRAELIVARMFAAHWLRRVRELEQELPPDSPLRTGKPSDA